MQLTAVRKGYLLTNFKWSYRRLRCTTHWGDVFFCGPVIGFQLIAGSGFFSGGIQFASYGENWSTSERHCLKDPRGASLLALAKSIQYILKQWVGFFARSDWLLNLGISCTIRWFTSSSSERAKPNSHKLRANSQTSCSRNTRRRWQKSVWKF